MPMLRKVVFATLMLAMASATAMACDCGTRPDEELFESADVVFAGTALYVDKSTGQSIFQVGRWIKGGGGDEVSVASTMCGYSFSEGFNYIVYAQEFNGSLIAGARKGSRVIGKSPPFISSTLKCGTFEFHDVEQPNRSFTEIAAVTGICVSLSLGLGLLVTRIKRRFRK
jgi:hypothetical protein